MGFAQGEEKMANNPYTNNDLAGLERFRRIAKSKLNIDPNRIKLGEKKMDKHIHLYLDDTTPKGKGALGCWGFQGGIFGYGPTMTEYNGKIYTQKAPLRSSDPILDDIIEAVIKKCLAR